MEEKENENEQEREWEWETERENETTNVLFSPVQRQRIQFLLLLLSVLFRAYLPCCLILIKTYPEMKQKSNEFDLSNTYVIYSCA